VAGFCAAWCDPGSRVWHDSSESGSDKHLAFGATLTAESNPGAFEGLGFQNKLV